MHESVSSARIYGKGVFTTVAVHDGEPFLWEKHWRRLTGDAAKLDIDLSGFKAESVWSSLAETVKKSGVECGRARITFSDESPSEIWSGGGEKKTGLSIITCSPRTVPDNFKLTISPNRLNTTSPIAGIKSCNYLEPLMAFQDAKNRGFDEAIRLNERGEIASACMANVFWLEDKKLYTPSLKTGCLAGTTREFVLENLECEEVVVRIDAIQKADAIFLTSAGIGAVRVAEIESRKLRIVEHAINSLLPKT